MNGAVIAALNESKTIGRLVSDMIGLGLEVVVIDDGSTDGTGEIASSKGAKVIRHHEPKGIGKSLMDGWKYAIERGWEYTVQIDAGGSHNPIDHLRVLRFVDDVYVGSRFTLGAYYEGRRWRALASRLAAALLNFATHKRITDWTSGYRVFSKKALFILSNIHYLTNMHTWQIEVLGEAIHYGLTVREFPITYKAGKSSMKLKTVFDLMKVYLWIFNR